MNDSHAADDGTLPPMPSRQRTAQSARIPSLPLSTAIDFVAEVNAGGGGRVSRDEAARRAGQSPSASSFRARLTSCRAFGLLEYGEWVEITLRGREILAGGPRALAARADAVLDSGFGGMIEAMDGEPAQRGVVQAKMAASGLVSAAAGPRLARVLLDSARTAGLVEAGRFSVARGIRQLRLQEMGGAPVAPAATPLMASHTEATAQPRGGGGGAHPVLGVIEVRLTPESEEILNRLIAHLDGLGITRRGQDSTAD